ncbi:mandelate racemase/muconate lactonizing enzyme family protein [Bordetella petrii]|uniref:mandelate racemase/muconate lactonizing enzyme family protein n=1 Tax=Bordetella petrii TaxID=94624 RepID=UPI001E3242F7|nr:mandelate racemase/muconate lactonizing enzyme family protein [Bordetella petrii]MCD0501828.1 mandelate racemase/muconate lactonizing enzyme family protein [Bordetella petrii]
MSNAVRITALHTRLAKIPLPRPLKTSIHHIADVCCLLVSVETDAGITGEGYGFCFSPERLAAIAQFTESLAPLVIGRDPHDVEALWEDFQRSCNFYGQAGVSILAYHPIDVACWDIVGKQAGQPLYKLFGAHRDRVPVYASAGLWLSSSRDELQAEARQFLAQGFKAMKMRLGSPDWKEDVARVEAVRDAIGDDITLMADANQGLDLTRALRLGRELARFDLAWFEEPVPTWDDDSAAEIRRRLPMPLASGETEYTRYGIRRMARAQAAGVFMPDLQRMGGYTEMLKAVRYLAAHDLPVAPHIFTEHSLHIVASAGNATWAEHMPWFEPLFHERMDIDADGCVAVPRQGGAGFTFNWDRIDPYLITPRSAGGN